MAEKTARLLTRKQEADRKEPGSHCPFQEEVFNVLKTSREASSFKDFTASQQCLHGDQASNMWTFAGESRSKFSIHRKYICFLKVKQSFLLFLHNSTNTIHSALHTVSERGWRQPDAVVKKSDCLEIQF